VLTVAVIVIGSLSFLHDVGVIGPREAQRAVVVLEAPSASPPAASTPEPTASPTTAPTSALSPPQPPSPSEAASAGVAP
jgi:hypothetical protein